MFYVVFLSDWLSEEEGIDLRSFITLSSAEEFINDMRGSDRHLIAMFEGNLCRLNGGHKLDGVFLDLVKE